MSSAVRITKREWVRDGGLSNPTLYRRMHGGVWWYYRHAQ